MMSIEWTLSDRWTSVDAEMIDALERLTGVDIRGACAAVGVAVAVVALGRAARARRPADERATVTTRFAVAAATFVAGFAADTVGTTRIYGPEASRVARMQLLCGKIECGMARVHARLRVEI